MKFKEEALRSCQSQQIKWISDANKSTTHLTYNFEYIQMVTLDKMRVDELCKKYKIPFNKSEVINLEKMF